jgi:copper chaperone NosL
MKTIRGLLAILICFLAVICLETLAQPAAARPPDTIDPGTRCPVCGMFVAKYPIWITRIRHADDTLMTFDGVKDMMVYYFTPEKFGGQPRDTIKDILVKDYYTLKWIDGREAFYVAGSDVYGPMGYELIPFSTREAAQSFLQDHHGKQIVSFAEIDEALIESLRTGQKMKP